MNPQGTEDASMFLPEEYYSPPHISISSTDSVVQNVHIRSTTTSLTLRMV